MDYYKILGVDKNSTPDDIKKAYRKLASLHHPDKGGDTTKFQEIQTAYDTLSDPTKKQKYDNPNSQQGFHFDFGSTGLNDIFQTFGNFNNIFNQQRGGLQTFRTRVTIELMDAYKGAQKTLHLQTNIGPNVINIDIPKGIMSGQQIRYENLIPNANLLVEFIVKPDLSFDRQLNDLYCNIPISVFDLIIGTKIFFTTISNKQVEVNIKPHTQPYMQLKLVGQGMPIINSNQYGDQILLLKPFIPDIIDNEIVEIIRKHKK
jgi:DnaJ-class molecular chaperone